MRKSFSSIAKRFSFGRKGRSSGAPTRSQGSRSWPHSHGFIHSYEKNPHLARQKKYETYSEMMANHPVISSGVRAFLAFVQKTEWTVEPIPDNADSERYAKAIEEIFENMETSLPQIMRRSAMYVYYGFGLQEWIAKPLPSGIIGIKDIEPRAQHTIWRWDITERGDIKGIEQVDYISGGEYYIDRRRLIYCVDDSLNDSPEGLGLFRQLYATAHRLEQYLMLEDIGFDTDLRGVPVVKIPLERIGKMVKSEEITAAEAEDIIEVFTSFIEDHQRKKAQGMMVDSEPYVDNEGKPTGLPQYSIELLKGDGSAQADLASAISRCRNDLAMVLASAFLLLGEDGAGSLALSKTKMDSFSLMVGSVLQYLATVYKRDLFRQIARLNGWDEESLPSLSYEEPKMQDIVELTEALKNLATAGGPFTPEDPIFDEVRGMMGFSARPEDLPFPEATDEDMFPGLAGAKGAKPKPGKEPANNEGK